MRNNLIFSGCRLIILLFAFLTIGSCSVTRQLGPRSERKIVANHMKQFDAKALVQDYSVYPLQQALIVDFLINSISYNDYNYSEIKSMRDSFFKDDILWDFFDRILAEREDAIQTKLEDMSIEEISKYYVMHPEENSFLTPFLKQTILPALDSADFSYVRHVHKLFAKTNLSYAIDNIYLPFKKEVWKEVSKYLDEYFEMEKEVVSMFRAEIDAQAYEYIDKGFQNVINACIEKEKLPWEENKVIEFTDEQLDRYLSEEKIFNIVKRKIDDYCTDFASVRQDMVKEILQESIYNTTYYLNLNKIYTNGAEFEPIYDHIISVSNIQHKINWTSWGLTAAGFIPYVGIVADIADFFYSRNFDKQKVLDINNNMAAFSSDLYDGYIEWYREYIENVTYSLDKELIESQARMKNILYENL